MPDAFPRPKVGRGRRDVYTVWSEGSATMNDERFGALAKREIWNIPAAVPDRTSNNDVRNGRIVISKMRPVSCVQSNNNIEP
jgi:hypothetical protein